MCEGLVYNYKDDFVLLDAAAAEVKRIPIELKNMKPSVT